MVEVEAALELVQDIRHQTLEAYHYCSIYREAVMQKKPIVNISNKKGMDSAKLPKDQVFLKVCRTYHTYHPRVLD